jgi:hypothetical protein
MALVAAGMTCGQSIDPRLMKQMLKLAAISVALTVNFGAAYAQNMPTPKPEDAERNAIQTPRLGKMHRLPPKTEKTGARMPIRRAG